MTSSNGNICRVTGQFCGKFTGHRWIPAQRPVARNFDAFCYLCNLHGHSPLVTFFSSHLSTFVIQIIYSYAYFPQYHDHTFSCITNGLKCDHQTAFSWCCLQSLLIKGCCIDFSVKWEWLSVQPLPFNGTGLISRRSTVPLLWPFDRYKYSTLIYV